MHLLDEHEEALEADLAHWYPGERDPLAAWRKGRPVNWRRLRVRVKGLPSTGTALARAMGVEVAGLTQVDYLLEGIANTANEAAWLFFALNRDAQKHPAPAPKPEPIRLPRPGDDEAEEGAPVKLAGDGVKRTPKGQRIATSQETYLILRGALKGA